MMKNPLLAFLPLLLASTASAAAAGAQLAAMAQGVEGQPPVLVGRVAGRPVAGAPAVPSPARARSFETLARETVQRGTCPWPDREHEDRKPYCMVAIDPEWSDRGGPRAWVSVEGVGMGEPIDPAYAYYHGETKIAPIGRGAHSDSGFWTVRTIMVEFRVENGDVRRASATRQTVAAGASCPAGAREYGYRVSDGAGGARDVLTCTVEEPLVEPELSAVMGQIRADWDAALRKRGAR